MPPTLPTEEEIWRRYDDDERRLTAPVSERMLDLAGLRPGHRVLDIATGRGEPAVRAAHRVAPGGDVLGTDLQPAMLAMARERADREGVRNLSLRAVDAQTLEGVPDAAFDVALARWGLMYLPDPVAALRAVRRCLRADGRLVAAVWTDPARVDYWSLPRRLLARHAAVAPPDLDAPGTFRYADPARLDAHLALAGLRPVHAEERHTPVMEAADADALVAWCRAFGLARLLAAEPRAVAAAWEADLRAAFEDLRDPVDGAVRLGGVTRIVVAEVAS